MAAPDKGAGRSGSTRRQFLLGGAVAGVGAAAAIGADLALSQNDSPTASASVPLNGDTVVPFYGAHQAGVDTDAQAHGTFVGLSLHDDVDRDGLRRLMQVLTDDASRLTQGEAALADEAPHPRGRPGAGSVAPLCPVVPHERERVGRAAVLGAQLAQHLRGAGGLGTEREVLPDHHVAGPQLLDHHVLHELTR